MCLPPQSKWTIGGLLSVVTCVKETVDTKPNPESFQAVYQSTK